MPLTPGTRIGPYEVVAPLGAGGMGEVYRARDTRLGRDVALKTLPAAFAADRERLERFEREARSAGSLMHPGIAMVFDVGTHENRPFIVSELVEGGTLRALIQAGPIKPARALEIGIALADALAAAHGRGIVHRDIKPENVAFTRDGRAKLLDFGLAKLILPELGGEDTSARTLDGTLLGTAAYMAPEQARGEPADHRVDLFALGCVILEMLTGSSPFHRDSVVETVAALLKDDPPPLPPAAREALPGVEVLLRRCLEKHPADRFESARDLACALEALRAAIRDRSPADGGGAARATASELGFRRLTFRRGMVLGARFTPDGHGIVYSASWEGLPPELFWVFGGATESRPLGIRDASLLAVSRNSELAIARGYRQFGAFISRGMLARVSLGAGTPRDVQAGVHYADWSSDGTQIAAVFDREGAIAIEYPLGHVVYRSDGGWLSEPRVSRDGRLVAFLDHPIRGDDGGSVCVVDREGQVKKLARYSGTLRGLAWSPDGSEVWFTGAPPGEGRALRAVSLDGAERLLLQIAGALMLHDVSADGRALITHGDERLGIQFSTIEPREDRDLSWFDWSLLRDLSRDGRLILFDESGEGGGEIRSVYVRATDGSPAIKLGDAIGMGFSPDEKWVLGLPAKGGELVILPVGAGNPRVVPLPGYDIHTAGWFPDGRTLWVSANPAGEALRLYRCDPDDGRLTPLTEPGVGAMENRVSPDGRFILAQGTDLQHRLYPVEGGEPVTLRGLQLNDRPAGWSGDGRHLYVYERGPMPSPASRVNLETGEREAWRTIGPSDPSGVFNLAPLRVSADGNSYAFSYGRVLIDLFEVRGLR